MRRRGHSDNGVRQDKHAGMQLHRGEGTHLLIPHTPPGNPDGDAIDSRVDPNKRKRYIVLRTATFTNMFIHVSAYRLQFWLLFRYPIPLLAYLSLTACSLS